MSVGVEVEVNVDDENAESVFGSRWCCRICGSECEKLLDFGRQPVSDDFHAAGDVDSEYFFDLCVGICSSCSMVQQMYEVPRELMFNADYPYRTSTSQVMQRHFQDAAQRFIETELNGTDPFIVEIGSNDGVMLRTISGAKIRHLGVDPSARAADVAAEHGVKTHVGFFGKETADAIRVSHGPANVIYSSNTVSHIAYIESIFSGVDSLLTDDGVFVIEDRYLGDIIGNTYLDQIYDEHFYLFSCYSVREMANRFGFELVDVEPLVVHGGSLRYTLARCGSRRQLSTVERILAEETERGINSREALDRFQSNIEQTRDELVCLLRRLRADGRTIVGYGATSKSATLLNYCGIGPDIVSFVCDSTKEKQGLVTPGSHIPIRAPDSFRNPYPDLALLLAWNHRKEIMDKEREFQRRGGRWILYVPSVHIV